MTGDLIRRYSWPKGHWAWPVQLTHKHGVRAANMVFTGGQVDLDSAGTVRNPGDVLAQCDGAMAYLARVLEDLGCDFNDLIRLVVYFIGDAGVEDRLMQQIAGLTGPQARPVINMIGLPELCYKDMMIEIEGVAMRAPDDAPLPRACLRLDVGPKLPEAFSHVVVCDGVLVTGDISATGPDGAVASPGDVQGQTRVMMDLLGQALALAGADYGDVLKLNVYYAGDGTVEDWEGPARIRASYFANPGPTPTGMPLPGFPTPDLMTKIYVTAMQGDKTHVWPDGHWGWTTPLPYSHGTRVGRLIHVGGQVSLDADANVLDPGDMVAQTRRAMKNVEAVLAQAGAGLDDVVKVTTYYQGSASAEALHENLLIRSNSYTDPGPATTGVPMPALVYRDMIIEIEVTAIAPTDA